MASPPCRLWLTPLLPPPGRSPHLPSGAPPLCPAQFSLGPLSQQSPRSRVTRSIYGTEIKTNTVSLKTLARKLHSWRGAGRGRRDGLARATLDQSVTSQERMLPPRPPPQSYDSFPLSRPGLTPQRKDKGPDSAGTSPGLPRSRCSQFLENPVGHAGGEGEGRQTGGTE